MCEFSNADILIIGQDSLYTYSLTRQAGQSLSSSWEYILPKLILSVHANSPYCLCGHNIYSNNTLVSYAAMVCH